MIYIEHPYNRAAHTFTDKSPLKTCFGYLPSSPLDVVHRQHGGEGEGTTYEAFRIEKFIDKIRQIHLQVQETLKKSQKKYKARHDRHRIEKTFKVGDKVWLHLNKKRLQGPGKVQGSMIWSF